MSKRATYRTDSTLGKLPEARQLEIAEYLELVSDGDRYTVTAAWLREDGIKVGRSALWSWYQSYSLARDFARADELAGFAQELAREANPELSADKLEAIGHAFFTKQALATRDAKAFQDIEYLRLAKESAKTKARQKDADLALANRRVSLLEENAASAKAKLTTLASKGGISPEVLAQIEEAARLL